MRNPQGYLRLPLRLSTLRQNRDNVLIKMLEIIIIIIVVIAIIIIIIIVIAIVIITI